MKQTKKDITKTEFLFESDAEKVSQAVTELVANGDMTDVLTWIDSDNRVVEILTKKTMKALKEYNVKNLILAGGVAANKGLRKRLQELCNENDINLTIPNLKYCTDNATMIGAAGYYAYKLGRIADLELNAKATDKLY